MNWVIGISGFLAWWAIGTAGLIYFWTDDLDMKPSELMVTIVAGTIIGPFALPMAGFVFVRRKFFNGKFFKEDKVLIKGRH